MLDNHKVQAIAFKRGDRRLLRTLQSEALLRGQHFLYADCGKAHTKWQILDKVARSFGFPEQFGDNFDVLLDCLTIRLAAAGEQQGFFVVLDRLHAATHLEHELQEVLLTVFLDAGDFWMDLGVPFRIYYSTIDTL